LVLVLALLVGLTIGRSDHRDDPIAGALLATFFSHPGATISQNFNTVWFAYEQLFEGSLFNFHAMRLLLDHPTRPIWRTPWTDFVDAPDATPLIVAGLGLAIGFRSNLFDIGGQGQVIAGDSSWPHRLQLEPVADPPGLLRVGGGDDCWRPARLPRRVLKAYTGATSNRHHDEQLHHGPLNGLPIDHESVRPAGVKDGASKAVTPTGQLPYFFSHLSSGLLVNVGFLIALAAVFVVQWFFNRSKTVLNY